MKTFLPSLLQNLTAAALMGLLLTQSVPAQEAATRPVTLYTQTGGEATFEAAVFPSLDPLILKVVFKNPSSESLTLRMRNAAGEVIYQKPLGRVESYNSRVYLSEVTDGIYTLEISGKSIDYVKPLRVGTTVARLAQVR